MLRVYLGLFLLFKSSAFASTHLDQMYQPAFLIIISCLLGMMAIYHWYLAYQDVKQKVSIRWNVVILAIVLTFLTFYWKAVVHYIEFNLR